MRYAVPKSTETRADKRAGRVFNRPGQTIPREELGGELVRDVVRG